jgi:hypothetical protein
MPFLLLKPDFAPALGFQIIGPVSLADKSRFFVVKAPGQVSDYGKYIQNFESLDDQFTLATTKLRKNEILFHAVNDKRTHLEKINAKHLMPAGVNGD